MARHPAQFAAILQRVELATVQLPSTRPVNTARFSSTDRISQTTVTAANWREVLVRLQNVYTNPIVLQKRNEAVGLFSAYMQYSDTLTNWRDRDGIRKAAIKQLKTHEQEFRALIAANNPASDEAQIALLEIQYMVGDFKATADGSLPLTQSLPPGILRDQAYNYLIRGYEGRGDVATSQKYLAELEKLNSDAANRFLGMQFPFGLLRQLADCYGLAQVEDDGAIISAGQPLGQTEAAARDKTRADAVKTYELFKKFLPQNQIRVNQST
jgi:hypothetical protein